MEKEVIKGGVAGRLERLFAELHKYSIPISKEERKCDTGSIKGRYTRHF
jgi:hypothetical protein